MATAWHQLLVGRPWFQGEDHFPIAAYSEYVPPPRLGCWPYRSTDPVPFAKVDPWGWNVTEYEEDFELRPGLHAIGHQLLKLFMRLGRGQSLRGAVRKQLFENPYWPPELREQAGDLTHDRYVCLLPLALSRTQDDKGRLRWTLFGGSEQGPGRAFWRGFFTAPGREVPGDWGVGFFRRLLQAAYREPEVDLRRAGFRILTGSGDLPFRYWAEEVLPSWAEQFLLKRGQQLRGVKYLLTFRPFAQLPEAVQQAYLAGDLHLLPFPGSLIPWGADSYVQLQQQLPLAMQIPLLELVNREEDPHGIRVPQAGWFDLSMPDEPVPVKHGEAVRDTYKRTHRFARVHRHENEVAVLTREDSVMNVLFSTAPEHMGLYNKPMARNAQVWTEDAQLILDGPLSSTEDLEAAFDRLAGGGLFGYRFQFPAMRVGLHELYWHRPLVAYLSPKTKQPAVLPDAPLGYLTAYKAARPDPAKPVEMWPRLLQREPHLAALELFDHAHNFHDFRTSLNIRKILNTRQLFGDRLLPRSFALRLLTAAKQETLESWLGTVAQRAAEPERGLRLRDQVESCLEPLTPASPNGRTKTRLPASLTYDETARRSFEVNYWKTIAFLAEGEFVNKVNADCISDPITQKLLNHHLRDLEALGDYLIGYHQKKIAAAGLTGKALVGEMPFHWRTDFDFSWSAGWVNNQEGRAYERNLVVVIPGRDRSRAVIMADHYDTAYMADHYEAEYGGSGARLAAAGADDNHSATAALMLAAPILLEMSKKGQLACDVWLVHLTGEEFPSDCLGARRLCQCLVEGNLKLRLAGGGTRNLSRPEIQGVYVLDMIAHNNDNDQDVFQISPGTGKKAMWLAYQAHVANELWNASAPQWNQRAGRRGRGRGLRSNDPAAVPDVALHPELRGEVRPPYDPRSTLYNTDGQIFSDAGVPVVLFMENYDIHRDGYHDSHDTMENIDLDYGAALCAITIEAVARAATEKP
jgi:hypothetical protein